MTQPPNNNPDNWGNETVESDNDELISEIDVVYSGEYSNEFTLLQFPWIPKNNLSSTQLSSFSINRDQQLLKLEKAIDIRYLDQRDPNLTSTQTLNGQKIESNTNLWLGIFRNGKLHLSPCGELYQFRHDFSAFEKDNDVNKIKKKDRIVRQGVVPKRENEEIKFTPLQMYYPQSIDSIKIWENIAIDDVSNYRDSNKHNINCIGNGLQFMNKEEYFNWLMKYINDKSIIDELNEKAIPADADEVFNNNHSVWKRTSAMKKQTALKAQSQGNNSNWNNNNNKNKNNTNKIGNTELDDIEMKADTAENTKLSLVHSCVLQTFGKRDCVSYDILLKELCEKFSVNMDLRDNGKLKELVENVHWICHVNEATKTVFLKEVGNVEELNNVRKLLLQYIGEGKKKPQIKNYLKENGIVLQESKLNKLLKNICDYGNTMWTLKVSLDS